MCSTTRWPASRLSMSFMLTPALNSYSPRFSTLRLPSSKVSRLNRVALSITPARSSCSAMLPPSSSRTILTILSAVSGPGFLASIISQATAPIARKAPTRTKVRNPLTVERVERRGGFGSFPSGDGALGSEDGLRARPKRLARGRGSFPLDCPLILSPASRLMPSRRPLQARARCDLLPGAGTNST